MYTEVPPYHFMTAISAFIGAHTILNKENNKCLFRESKQVMIIQMAAMHFLLEKYLEITCSKPENVS